MTDKIDLIAEKMDEKVKNYTSLCWTQYTTGFDFGLTEAYKEMEELMKDKEIFHAAQEALKSNTDGEAARKSQLFYRVVEEYHQSDELNTLLDTINQKTHELSSLLHSYQFQFEGKEISHRELSQIYTEDKNRERRRAAFFAQNQVNKPLIEGGFTDLIKMRNKAARLAGKKNFTEWQLQKSELDSGIFSGWKEELQKALPVIRDLNKKYGRSFLNDDTIFPWDSGYIRNKSAPVLKQKVGSDYHRVLREFFKNFDIHLDNYNITYDLYPRKNKAEWAFQFTVDQGRDSRILANVTNSYIDFKALLHETGHSIHSFMLNPEERILNRGVSEIISEGIANLFGSFFYEEIFYKQFFCGEEIKRAMEEIKEMEKLSGLMSIHRILFDQELYKRDISTEEDIKNLFHELYKECFSETPYDEDPPWGILIHHITHPVHLHNYLMGDVTCEMIKNVFYRKYGTSSIMEKPRKFKEFLYNELIKPSGRYTYPELIHRITGKCFTLEHILSLTSGKST